MPDTKVRPTSTMKSKDKSNEPFTFGHLNATNRTSYLNIIFIKLVTQKVKTSTALIVSGSLKVNVNDAYIDATTCDGHLVLLEFCNGRMCLKKLV